MKCTSILGMIIQKNFIKKTEVDYSDPKFMEMIKPTGTQSAYLWAGFGICGVTDIIFIDGRLDGATYVETLKQGLIPFLQKHHISNDSYLLLDDNSRIHDCTIA